MSLLLTGRERQVAELVAEGLTNKQIARRLSITTSTVKHHVSEAIAKTGVEGRVLLARSVWAGALPWNGA